MLSRQARNLKTVLNRLSSRLSVQKRAHFNNNKKNEHVNGAIPEDLGPLYLNKKQLANGTWLIECSVEQIHFMDNLKEMLLQIAEDSARTYSRQISRCISSIDVLDDLIAIDEFDTPCEHLFGRGLEDQIVDEATEKLQKERNQQQRDAIRHLIEHVVGNIGDSYHGITYHSHISDMVKLIENHKQLAHSADNTLLIKSCESNVIRGNFAKSPENPVMTPTFG